MEPAPRNDRERAVVRHREVRGAAARVARHALEDGRRLADDFQARDVEASGEQHSRARVDEGVGRHEAGHVDALHHDAALAGRKGEGHEASLVVVVRAVEGADREEDRAAAGEENGPAVGALSLVRLGRHHGLGHPSGRAHAPQAGVVRRDEEDRAVGRPTRRLARWGRPPRSGPRRRRGRSSSAAGRRRSRARRRPGRRRDSCLLRFRGWAAPRAGRRRARGSSSVPRRRSP